MAEKAKVVENTQETQTVAERLRSEAEDRLKEVNDQLGPLQKEKEEIEELLARPNHSAPAESSRQRSSGQPRQRRSRKGGTVEERALKVIKDNPGINATGVAESLGIKPNYLYRVLGDAANEKRVRKEGTGYHVVES